MITDRHTAVIEHLSAFLRTPLDTVLQQRLAGDPRQNALQLFRHTVESVPAYRQFLQSRGVNPERIDSFETFQSLPPVDKVNYMQPFPLPQRCKGGRLTSCDRLAVS